MVQRPERSVGTGTAHVVVVQADGGMTVHVAAAALESDLRISLRSSDASCNLFSPLRWLQFSWARSPIHQSPCQGPSCFLYISLNRSCGRPRTVLPAASSPYRMPLGILSCCILRKCLSQRRRRCRSRV